MQRLRPDLHQHIVCQVIQTQRCLSHSALHRPEAAVARVALKEVIYVGRSEEHTLPAVVLLGPPVGRAVLVSHLGNERLERLHRRTVVVLELAHLDDPAAAQLLHGVLRPDVIGGKRVAEPLHP